VLWEHKSSGSKNPNQWKENMSELATFKDTAAFWRSFRHIPPPSAIFFDGDCRKKVGGKTVEEFSMFKKGIEPEWGDAANASGGEWFCRQYFDTDILDLYWQNLVLAVVGEAMEDAVNAASLTDVINGIRVVDKSRGYPTYKLEVWINTRDETIKEAIKDQLQKIVIDGQRSNSKSLPKWEWKDHV
jgi:translation initiation factor 4E